MVTLAVSVLFPFAVLVHGEINYGRWSLWITEQQGFQQVACNNVFFLVGQLLQNK